MSLFFNVLIIAAFCLGNVLFSTPWQLWLWCCGIAAISSRLFGISDNIGEAVAMGLLQGFIALAIGGLIGWLLHLIAPGYPTIVGIVLFQYIFARVYATE